MQIINVAITQEPVYDKNIKQVLYVKGIFSSQHNIVENMQTTNKNITRIKSTNLPFVVDDRKQSDTVYVIDWEADLSVKSLYVLQVTLVNDYKEIVYVYCNDDDNVLRLIAGEFMEEEFGDDDEEKEVLNDSLTLYGKYEKDEFENHAKRMKFLMYYFDIETELQ